MPTHARVWTPDEVRELQDESRPWPRYELIDGELHVTPAPRPVHQVAAVELLLRIAPYVKVHGLGRALLSPADIALDQRSVLQPDVFVVPRGQLGSSGGPEPTWREVTGLLLAVEVVSPSSARRDHGVKRRYYQRHGVPEYWIVDLDARLVERWRPADERPEILSEALAWQPRTELAPLTLDMSALFEEVHEEAGEA
ncbi:MAG TPA: Uma2 family endonuclease [Gemmatimonadaceae bacterium]|nr:Uma2 family endonuclease [Gemmatimonadaceae bacterium]